MDRRDISRNLFAVAVGAAVLDKRVEAQTCTAPCFAITQAEAGIPVASINTTIPPYRADRYGFSNVPGTTGAANAISLGYAVKAATAAGARLKIPGSVAATPGATGIYGTPYPYASSSVLELTCDVEGDGELGTFISCSGGAKGNNFAYFRLTGEKELRDLSIENGGAIGDLTIGLQLSNSTAGGGPTEATGHMRVTRVLVSGFDTNIQVERTFLVTFDQVRSQLGGYGFYCQPNVTAPCSQSCKAPQTAPIISTHVHLNCIYEENSVNIFYQTTPASYNVTFLNGASQGATAPYAANGASYSNFFGDIVNLHFIDWYCEASPAAIVIGNGGGNVTFDGLWLGSTGGIYLGTGNYARFINVRTASANGAATDNLAGGGGSGAGQIVTMENCIWPNTGAGTGWAHLVLMQSSIDGTFTTFSST